MYIIIAHLQKNLRYQILHKMHQQSTVALYAITLRTCCIKGTNFYMYRSFKESKFSGFISSLYCCVYFLRPSRLHKGTLNCSTELIKYIRSRYKNTKHFLIRVKLLELLNWILNIQEPQKSLGNIPQRIWTNKHNCE